MNDAVLGLGSLSRINERCLELKQGKPKRQAAEAAKQKRKVMPAGTQQSIRVVCSDTIMHKNGFCRDNSAG